MGRTIKCKMRPSDGQASNLARTAVAFAEAATIALQHATEAKTSNRIRLQHLCYREIKKRTSLSANLVIRAIARACWAVRAARAKGKTVNAFRPTSIDYDQRIFEWREQDEQVSLSTLDGRIRVPLALGEYQRSALAGKRPTCAKVVRERKGWSIHIVVSDEPGKSTPVIGAIGVDRGIYNVAVTSTGRFYGGRKSLHQRKKNLSRKARLQRKGTRAAKRTLKRLSRKESRRVRDQNHVVSKAIVAEAKASGSAVALEDLKGIRNRRGMKRQSGKKSRTMLNAWPFRQLEEFIRYKAEQAGVQVVEVPAYRSSHTCPRCTATGDDVKRSGPHFMCGVCGYRAPADLVAACVIAERGRQVLGIARAAVNRPIVASELHSCASVTSPVL
jgi:IS605 OrfB family transposase